MKAPSNITAGSKVRLDRADIIENEHFIKDCLGEFLNFKSYSLFLPHSLPGGMKSSASFKSLSAGVPVHMPEQKELLLPLTHQDSLMAVFVARGVSLKAPKSSLPYIGRLAEQCLEKILLYKSSVTDALTGLGNERRFMDAVEEEIGIVIDCLTPSSGMCMELAGQGFSSGFGLVLLDLDRLKWVNRTFGHAFGDQVLKKAAEILAGLCPEGALAARLCEDTLGVFWPGASPKKCRDLAEDARKALAREVYVYQVSGERVSVTASVGQANYPQDMSGPQLQKSAPEQARIILEKCQKALDTAKAHGRNQARSFASILGQGGQVLEVLPLGRVVVNLGRTVDAQESMRFLVWPRKFDGTAEVKSREDEKPIGHYPSMYKGEVVLMDVQDEIAVAEVIYLSDPSWELEPGDRLSLLTEKDAELKARELKSATDKPVKDILTGLYSYRDFMRALPNSDSDRFCLSMIRLKDAGRDLLDQNHVRAEHNVREIASQCRATFGKSAIGGRYSLNCLIFYTPGQDPGELQEKILDLCAKTEERFGARLAAGTAFYPCLNYDRTQVLENCRKALEHAQLLKSPRAALFDSLSLTINADRLLGRGDLYAAMEEYKAALLADESNTLARNSLGICFARLGRLNAAKQHFKTVFTQDSQNLMALYNHGYTSLRLGETGQAKEAFKNCLLLNPRHIYSLLRLGQLAEQEGDPDKAEKFYRQAAKSPQGEGITKRHLARLALGKNRLDEARELLHQALVHNPKDAFSMHLLAKLYLDMKEDPQIAETLARQSATLRPDQAPFWRELARALTAQGKKDEAKAVLERADTARPG